MSRAASSLGLGALFVLAAACAGGDGAPDDASGQVTPGAGAAGKAGASAGHAAAGAGTGGAKAGTAGTAGMGGDAGANAGAAGASAGMGGTAGASAGTGGASAGMGGTAGASAGTSGASAGMGGDAGTAGASAGVGGGAGAGGGSAGTGGSAGNGLSGSAGAGAGGGSAGTGGSAGNGLSGSAGAGAGGGSAGAGGSAGNGLSGSAGAAGGGGGATPGIVVLGSQSPSGTVIRVYTPAKGWASLAAPASVAATGRPLLAAEGAGVRVVVKNANTGTMAEGTMGLEAVGSFVAMQGGFGGELGAISTTPTRLVATLYPSSQAHHLATAIPGAAFAAPLLVGSTQLSGGSPSSVGVAGDDTWVAYSGFDAGLYVVHHDGSSWSAASGVFGAGAKSDVSPTLVMDGAVPVLFYVEGGGNPTSRVCGVRGPGGSFGGVECHAAAITSRRVGAARLASGEILVAWHAYEGGATPEQGIYAARYSAQGTWGPVLTVDPATAPSTAPVVLPGLGTTDAEILYVRGGKVTHARLTGDTVALADGGGAGLAELGAAIAQGN